EPGVERVEDAWPGQRDPAHAVDGLVADVGCVPCHVMAPDRLDVASLASTPGRVKAALPGSIPRRSRSHGVRGGRSEPEVCGPKITPRGWWTDLGPCRSRTRRAGWRR